MSFRDRIKGRYAIEAKLGAGSFGEVYTCWDTKKSRNDDDIKVMNKLTEDHNVFPKKIVDFFGYDNETLFSVKLNEHNVPVQWLDDTWHYFFDTQGFIPEGTNFVHAINKRFDIVWRRYYD